MQNVSEDIILIRGLNKKENYESLIPQLKALTEGEHDTIANTANIIAAIKEVFGFFWVGIYFVKTANGKEELVLGPFQGPPACIRIAKGKGVCGTSWESGETIVVPDVNLFPGHIACSALSKSEIVVPVKRNNIVLAVLDADSISYSAFDEVDKFYLEQVAEIISKLI